MNGKLKLTIYRILPLIAFLLLWEFALRGNDRLIFYFGLPSRIWAYIVAKTANGTLPRDIGVTMGEALAGFILGNFLGTLTGLSLWFSNSLFRIAKPYIIALGSAPIFALAPLMIIWFGTGLLSKIIMATLSTVFVALFQAYTGAAEVDPTYLKLLKSMKASKTQVFRKVIAPSSVVWVLSAFKINVGFALLGAFIGEYISSSEGLGHLILVASGLFDISLVLTGVLFLMIIAIGLSYLAGRLETPIKRWVSKSL